jgi:hypothetical protein
MENIMKITRIFARRTPRTRQPRIRAVANLTEWSSTDWADLPVYHPRQD